MSTEERRWFKRYRGSTGTGAQLLCFHHAGGSAAVFRDWRYLLPGHVEPIAIQLPGRADRTREAAYTDMVPLVQRLADVLEPLTDRPFAFFGASMGARVSWHLAHELRARGLPSPLGLFVSSSAAPSLERTIRGWDGPDDALIGYMVDMGGTPTQVLEDPDLLARLLPVLRADLTVLSTHIFQPDAPLEVPIVAFAGAGDEEVPPARMEPWGIETAAGFSLEIVDGGHFLSPLGLRQVTEAVARRIYRPGHALPLTDFR
jgi:medium-chain acyl-[acyl-carrier-protein] hydrolase